MDSVHLGQAAHAPPVYRMVPPYNFEKLHLPHLLTPVPARLEAAAGYRLPGVRGWGHFRGSKRPQVGPVQRIVLSLQSAHLEGTALYKLRTFTGPTVLVIDELGCAPRGADVPCGLRGPPPVVAVAGRS